MNSLTRYTGFLCIVAFLSLSLFSCGGSPEEPVTAQHAKDFARQIQSSMEKRQAAFFDNAFDKKKFLKKAGLPNERDARAFSSALEDKLNMGTQLINSISEKGTYLGNSGFSLAKHLALPRHHEPAQPCNVQLERSVRRGPAFLNARQCSG